MADLFIRGLPHSITARYFSSNPSDSGSLRTPCPPASKPAGRRGITPAFGYSAPHPNAGGTLTLLIHALPSAHYEAVRRCPAHRYFRPRGWRRLRLFPWHRRSGSHVPYKSRDSGARKRRRPNSDPLVRNLAGSPVARGSVSISNCEDAPTLYHCGAHLRPIAGLNFTAT